MFNRNMSLQNRRGERFTEAAVVQVSLVAPG